VDDRKKSETDPARRILIADDDQDFRGLLKRRALKMGLEVHEAVNGAQAMHEVQAQNYDALVVDLYMPEHTGLEVIEEARAQDPDIVALILTGSASVESAVEALRAGVFDYLTKPLESLAAFDLALTRALEHRALINENKQLFEEVQRLAVTDTLTGLFNRRKLQESLNIEVERAHRYRRPLSLIMIDMDRLKEINDTYGHTAGDEALKLVAEAIRVSIRKVDLATRFGGDEFVILLPEADYQEANTVVNRVKKEIKARVFKSGTLSVSIGVVQWKPEFTTSELFLQAADGAMYETKRRIDS
jgi:two-component system cell cycle response regulator